MNEEKIFEINELLSNGASLNQLDKSGQLGCSRKAFKNRASKIGYIYDDSVKQFVKNGTVTLNNTSVTHRESAPKNTTKKADTNQELLLKIDALEKRLKDLEAIVLQDNTMVTLNNFLEFDKRTSGEIITRSFKVSKDAVTAFNEVAENQLKLYSKQQLFSQALLEFAEKYKK